MRLVDSFSQMQLTEDREKTLKVLRSLGIKTPRSFFGKSEKIPDVLGEELVRKHPFGHQVSLVKRDKFLFSKSRENVYVEERIQNKDGAVRCVMYIFGKIYTRIKKDKFHAGYRGATGNEPVVSSTLYEINIAKKVHKKTGMNLFNVDLIKDTVIEINCCPNFFSYNPAINHFVKVIQARYK